MQESATVSVDDVRAVVVETVGVPDRADDLGADTPLMECLPELDSMAVLELVIELEQHFAIEVDGEDMTAEVFETLATLTSFVNRKLA